MIVNLLVGALTACTDKQSDKIAERITSAKEIDYETISEIMANN